jgi:hypothetical protein
MAGFGRINCNNRTLRLEITKTIIGREITSAKDLKRREGLQLVRVLSDLETGAANLEIAPDGKVTIIAREENQA